MKIPVPEERREADRLAEYYRCRREQSERISMWRFRLGVMTCVTGVSGSGKSSLVNEILYKRLARNLNRARTIPGKHKNIEGLEQLGQSN